MTPSTSDAPRGGGRRAWLLRGAGLTLLLALLAFLVWRGQLQPAEILRVLGHADPALVVLSVVIYFPFVLIKSERWRLLAGDLGVHMSPGEAWKLYAVGLGAGAFTPGQAGDLVKAWALQRRGHRLGAAVAASVLDRLCDIAGLAPLALLGIAIFGGEFGGGTLAVVLLSAGAVAAVVVFARRDMVLRLVSRRAARADASSGAALPASLSARTLLIAAAWTVLSFAVSTFRVWLLAAAISLPLDLWQVGGIVGLTTVAALVPVSVSGVGTRDAMMIALLGRFVQPAAAANALALALSTLILVLNIANALFGYAVWWVETRSSQPAPGQAPQ